MVNCTDRVASMAGKHSRVVARVKKLVPNIIQTHYMIHRQALAATHCGQSVSEVLSLCVKVVNSMKTCPLHSRLFSQLCHELGSEHSNLLLHTEVRWLFQEKVVERMFELREDVLLFCKRTVRTLLLVSNDLWL